MLIGAGCGASESEKNASPEIATPGDATNEPLSGDAWEIAEFSRVRAITLGEAKRRLDQQAQLPTFNELVTNDLGVRLGGTWIDVNDGDRIKVGVTSEAGMNMPELLQRWAAAISMQDGEFDVVPMRHAWQDLEKANDWLGDELARVNEGAEVAMAARIRTELNAVELQLPMEGILSEAQLALLKTAEDRLGDMLIHGEPIAPIEARACSYPYCDKPLRGGIEISASAGICTGAFIARSRVSSNLFQFTAGHCAAADSGDWETLFLDGSDHTIGAPTNHVFGNSGDMAILKINNVPGWNPKNWVLVTSSPDTTYNDSYTITATGGSTVGMRVCTTGSQWGQSSCGNVIALGVTATYGGKTVKNLGQADFCGTGGDSGAPVYASHKAYGLQVAGTTPCDSYYQGINAAANAMNVNVLTAPP